jgi:hypothetical protein
MESKEQECKMDKYEREEFFALMLETEDLTLVLERFDLTPEECLELLFINGFIDPETLDELAGY